MPFTASTVRRLAMILTALLVAGITAAVGSSPATATHSATLITPPAGSHTGSFGVVMEVDHEQLFVAAPEENGSQGAVYVYDLDALGSAPTELALPAGLRADARFGSALTVWGNRLAVGAPSDQSVASKNGRVYVYDLTNLGAAPMALTPPDEVNQFGTSLALFGDTLLVAAPFGGTDGSQQRVTPPKIYFFDLTDPAANPIAVTAAEAGAASEFAFGSQVDAGPTAFAVNTRDDGVFLFDPRDPSAAPVHVEQSHLGINSGTSALLSGSTLVVSGYNTQMSPTGFSKSEQTITTYRTAPDLEEVAKTTNVAAPFPVAFTHENLVAQNFERDKLFAVSAFAPGGATHELMAPSGAPAFDSYSVGAAGAGTAVASMLDLGTQTTTGLAVWNLSRPEGSTFSDVAGTTHEAGITALASRGIIGGFADGTYRPQDPITRGQLATIISGALELPPAAAGPAPFSDIAGTTHEDNIRRVAAAGIVGGFADGTFRPDDLVTRGQAATIIANALGLPPVSPGDPNFSDIAGTTHEDNIRRVAAAGIVGGFADGTFRPGDNLTRGQMATIVAGAVGLI